MRCYKDWKVVLSRGHGKGRMATTRMEEMRMMRPGWKKLEEDETRKLKEVAQPGGQAMAWHQAGAAPTAEKFAAAKHLGMKHVSISVWIT